MEIIDYPPTRNLPWHNCGMRKRYCVPRVRVRVQFWRAA